MTLTRAEKKRKSAREAKSTCTKQMLQIIITEHNNRNLQLHFSPWWISPYSNDPQWSQNVGLPYE